MNSIDLTTATETDLDALYETAIDARNRDLMALISKERMRRTGLFNDAHNARVAADRMARDAAVAADAAALNALIDNAR